MLKLLKKAYELLVDAAYFVYSIIFVLPKWMWLNRKRCPYWDYPICKMGSLVTGMSEPCKLGDAVYTCLHYKRRCVGNARP